MSLPDSPIVLHVAGKSLSVWPKISERSRRVRLSVKPGPRIELSYPAHTSRASAIAFLHNHLPWLETAVSKVRPIQPSLLKHLAKFPWATLDNRLVAISLASSTRAKLQIAADEETVIFGLPTENREEAAVRLARRLADTGLPSAVARLSERVGVSVGQVSVRDQTSRWGSCSHQGTLSLNWRLILLPPLIHDHVILHELAHRRYMDHSDRFWTQLATWDPEWKKHDRELSKRWGTMMDLGR